jgi:hypothetical protein
MIDIVITADYEIFGNGTGDVRHCLVSPTTDLLSICDKYGAKLTLFFEIAEYWALQKAEAEGKLSHLDYSPIGLMKNQAEKAVKRGHDVQLHLHPQWLDSELTDHGWRLNFDYWRLPNVPHGLGNSRDLLSLRGILLKGKNDLEEMLKHLCNDYECIAFRAGGHCIQPAREVIRAMREVGLVADSSVFKGGYIQEEPFEVDFRSAHDESTPWWADPEDINKALTDGNGTILEAPIYAVERRRIKRLTIGKLLHKFKRLNMQRPLGCKGYSAVSLHRRPDHKNPVTLFNYLFEPVAVQWDYCALTHNEMWWFLKRFLKKKLDKRVYSPLIMIGHPKVFTNHANFSRFLDRVTHSSWFQNGHIHFSTMRDAVRKAMKSNSTASRRVGTGFQL